jgi:hypothetical protein
VKHFKYEQPQTPHPRQAGCGGRSPPAASAWTSSAQRYVRG